MTTTMFPTRTSLSVSSAEAVACPRAGFFQNDKVQIRATKYIYGTVSKPTFGDIINDYTSKGVTSYLLKKNERGSA